MQQKPKALIFDVFGTCVDWRTSIAYYLTDLADEIHLPTRNWYEFTDAWRGTYQPQLETVRNGSRPWTKLEQLNKESLDTILDQFGLNNLTAEQKHKINEVWTKLTPWSDTVPGLTLLKQQFIIAPCSNADISLSVRLAKHAQLPWDAILGAEISNSFKPQPETYLQSVAALGLHPEEVLMVAAHNSDLQAAQRCGLQVAFIPRPHEFGAMQNSDLFAEKEYNYVADNLIHLSKLLGVQ